MKRDLLSLADLTPAELSDLFELAGALKLSQRRREPHPLLQGRALALLFEHPSLRTRVTFELGMAQLGGYAIYLGPETGLGQREAVADVARNLSRWVDGIMARVRSHQTLEGLSSSSSVPVINGLSDLEHPCQVLGDLFTLHERFGRLEGLTIAWIGDGNNVCNSLMLGAGLIGLELRVATPEGYEPRPELIERAQRLGVRSGARLKLGHDPEAAVEGAQAVYTDVWISMGLEAEAELRRKKFERFQVNQDLLGKADPGCLVMHCLPAHRGEEITSDVLDGPRSVVLDQAENRLHIQKAILVKLLKG